MMKSDESDRNGPWKFIWSSGQYNISNLKKIASAIDNRQRRIKESYTQNVLSVITLEGEGVLRLLIIICTH